MDVSESVPLLVSLGGGGDGGDDRDRDVRTTNTEPLHRQVRTPRPRRRDLSLENRCSSHCGINLGTKMRKHRHNLL